MRDQPNHLESPATDTATAIAPKRWQRRVLLLGVPLLVALAAIGIYLHGGRYVETDNAYLKADKLPISAEVAGTVSALLVKENQSVSAGQALFQLDSRPLQMQVDKAQAQLAQVRTELQTLQASYRSKQAEMALARTKYSFALKEQQRQAELLGKNFISAAKFDEAKEAAELAQQTMHVLERSLQQITTSLAGNAEGNIEQHPSYRAAYAQLAQTQLDLQRSTVFAPVAGVVSKLPKLGQYLELGSTALALVASQPIWIEANFPETDLTYVQPGQAVTISVDTYPDYHWSGEVESVSPATGAEFSILPAQNATGNWVKITQRVPVRIRLVANQTPAPVLRAGLSSIVEIDTGHRRQLLGLTL